MKEIKLAGKQELTTVVDDEDFELLSAFTWWADRKRTTTYAFTQIDGRTVRMHQMIMGIDYADHKDGDGLNNQKSNLRAANRNQQSWNTRSRSGDPNKGVTFQSRLKHRPWQSRIAK